MPSPEILVIEREASVAHPSFARGGYVVLAAGATAYRNADMVPADPGDILTWCRDKGCEITEMPDPEPSYRRRRIRFPDEAVLAAFKERFPGKPR